ncbi:peptidoglycan-recognition protein SB1-like [Macrosteles quadrilineatus]|uniref:peptidoglycan-recognition protein SB1-like n=1 Tax=Macrosteles quadrilineatus TaxID=74068 RepID=UPI0023E14A79|nr:peptidoglycan-recognition protein SB1-like [Macrosteles quadrilineatus]
MNFLDTIVVIPRAQWNAKQAKKEEEIEEVPVPYLVVYHDHKNRCRTENECMKVIEQIQKDHMDKGESDILYHFIVTMDGNIYEGRSTKSVGMKFPENESFKVVNKKSITVGCLDNGEKEVSIPVLKSFLKVTEKLRREGVINYDVHLKIHFPKGHPREKDTQNDSEEVFSAMRMMGGSSGFNETNLDSKKSKEKKRAKKSKSKR